MTPPMTVRAMPTRSVLRKGWEARASQTGDRARPRGAHFFEKEGCPEGIGDAVRNPSQYNLENVRNGLNAQRDGAEGCDETRRAEGVWGSRARTISSVLPVSSSNRSRLTSSKVPEFSDVQQHQPCPPEPRAEVDPVDALPPLAVAAQ